jgi:hypothetical protein
LVFLGVPLLFCYALHILAQAAARLYAVALYAYLQLHLKGVQRLLAAILHARAAVGKDWLKHLYF